MGYKLVNSKTKKKSNVNTKQNAIRIIAVSLSIIMFIGIVAGSIAGFAM